METESTNYSDAYKKFSTWIETNETKLNSSCHCNFNNVTQAHANNFTSTPTTAVSAATNQINNKQAPINTNHNNSNSNNHNIKANSNHPTTNQNSNNHNNINSNKLTNNQNSNNQIVNSQNTCNNSTSTNHAIITNHTPNPGRYLGWKNVIQLHEKLQGEVEEVGKKLNDELKKHLNSDKSLGEKEVKESADLEERWHKLWLKSLEQLVVVERSRRCPKHNTTLIGKPNAKNLSPANKSMAQPQRRRPISYPSNNSERLEWDYDHTLSLTGCHKENGSQVDLDSVDEQITKNLTEFGENYELWFGKEDEVACISMHSRPASVEPAEKPEFAKATVTSNSLSHDEVNCNLLMLTNPSSMLTVDATKLCSHNSKKQIGYSWRILLFLITVLVLLYSSALFQEPHHMHKSYYHTQPPV